MATYDKEKILGLLERRRAAGMNLRDLSDRAREERATISRMRQTMERNAMGRAPAAVIERLLDLPLQKALALQKDDVCGYAIERKGGGEDRHITGIVFETWLQYQGARQKHERLVASEATLRAEFDEQFGVVPRLLDAIREWGFNNPELEV
jgi:hypothetical protein